MLTWWICHPACLSGQNCKSDKHLDSVCGSASCLPSERTCFGTTMAMKFGFSRKVRIVPPVPSTEAGVSQHPTLFWQLHVTASTDFSAQSTSERVESKANFPIPNVSGYQARKSLCALPLPALAHTHGDGAFSSAGRHSAQPLELHYIQSSKAAICRKLMSCKQHCAAASLKRARSAHCRYNYCV